MSGRDNRNVAQHNNKYMRSQCWHKHATVCVMCMYVRSYVFIYAFSFSICICTYICRCVCVFRLLVPASVAITYALIHERFLAVCTKTPGSPSSALALSSFTYAYVYNNRIFAYVRVCVLHFQCSPCCCTLRVAFASHLFCWNFIFTRIFYFSYSQFAYFVLHSTLFSPASATFHLYTCTLRLYWPPCPWHMLLSACNGLLTVFLHSCFVHKISRLSPHLFYPGFVSVRYYYTCINIEGYAYIYMYIYSSSFIHTYKLILLLQKLSEQTSSHLAKY